MFSWLRQLRPNNFIGFDKYRKRGAYHWQEIVDNPDYRALIDTISGFLAPEQTVLDIGCGDGAYLGAVAGKIKAGWGIDAEAVAIKLAREKFYERGITNCRVENLRIDQAKKFFAHNGQRFDLIWSADVIEHLPRPGELLELILQVLKPAKLCLMGTPLYISDELVSPYHVKEYTREEIRAILNSCLDIRQEIILPHMRKDGKTYSEGYYLAAGHAKANL